MEITNINQLDLNKIYTYKDYLLWKFKEQVELYKGRVLKMSPAPSRMHQEISSNINRLLDKYFHLKKCKLYYAPFDVRFYDASGEIRTVVQPDLCVVCDESKLDERGCLGAPDLVVEILSPGNSKREMDLKFNLYQEAGVMEYWIVNPREKFILIYILENGRFIGLKPIIEGQSFKSVKFPELEINSEDIFENISPAEEKTED
ncbi:Uma2 family endonuclease [Elizabethkingia ursingii]